MDQQKWLAEQCEDHRPRLRAVAYRMLGSLSEADDAVQDAWLRVSRADTSDIENLSAWLTAVVARVALKMLRGARGSGARAQPPVACPPLNAASATAWACGPYGGAKASMR